ncbi:ribonuclease H-like domain-containing protein [Tanacetum coccineum]
MNCHVTTTSPLPRSHVHALRDPNWKEAMLDEYNALITNGTWVLVPRLANVNVIPMLSRVGDEEVVVGEGVVRFLSSFVRSTKSCFGGMMVGLIFLNPWEEDASMVKRV